MLKVTDKRRPQTTAVSNEFLDRFMPQASGEFVKIYLYLLRNAGGAHPLTPEAVADVFSCTENDILRAYKYWDEKGLLRLVFRDGVLSELIIPDPAAENKKMPADSATTSAGSTATPTPIPLPSSERQRQVTGLPTSMSRALLNSEKEEGKQAKMLLFIAERYLKHPLSTLEMDKLLYLLSELHMPFELLDYLIQYCVTKGKSSIHYIEKVGLEWYNDGIRTIPQAKEHTDGRNRDYFMILNAFGITGRSPVSLEIDFMKRWIHTYGFSMELIQEACTRTIMKKQKPSFEYAEGILTKWKDANAYSMTDVERLDEEHQKELEANQSAANEAEQSQKKAFSNSSKRRTPAENRFNNFRQRSYDYAALEKQLLDRQMAQTETSPTPETSSASGSFTEGYKHSPEGRPSEPQEKS